jgi:hypothetical protein
MARTKMKSWAKKTMKSRRGAKRYKENNRIYGGIEAKE